MMVRSTEMVLRNNQLELQKSVFDRVGMNCNKKSQKIDKIPAGLLQIVI